MKVYVAGRSSIRNGVEDTIKKLKASGFKITFDWTKHPHFIYREQPELAKKYSELELQAIDSSDVFILVSDREGSGMYVEMGYALAKGKPVYIIGEWNQKPIFMFHPQVIKRQTIREVISDLKHNLASKRA